MTTTPACFATFPSASVLGPGTGSARSNSAGSSCWAKYCDRNSSGRQTSRAPAAAASDTFATAFLRLASVAALAHGEDVSRHRGIGLELAPQLGHVRVHGAAQHRGAVPPHLGEQLHTADDSSVASEQRD